jgi:hypothetical protein
VIPPHKTWSSCITGTNDQTVLTTAGAAQPVGEPQQQPDSERRAELRRWTSGDHWPPDGEHAEQTARAERCFADKVWQRRASELRHDRDLNGTTQTLTTTTTRPLVNWTLPARRQTITATYAVKVGDSATQNLVVTITGTNDQTVRTDCGWPGDASPAAAAVRPAK